MEKRPIIRYDTSAGEIVEVIDGYRDTLSPRDFLRGVVNHEAIDRLYAFATGQMNLPYNFRPQYWPPFEDAVEALVAVHDDDDIHAAVKSLDGVMKRLESFQPYYVGSRLSTWSMFLESVVNMDIDDTVETIKKLYGVEDVFFLPRNELDIGVAGLQFDLRYNETISSMFHVITPGSYWYGVLNDEKKNEVMIKLKQVHDSVPIMVVKTEVLEVFPIHPDYGDTFPARMMGPYAIIIEPSFLLVNWLNPVIAAGQHYLSKPHPHVGRDGTPCFGSLEYPFMDAQENYDFAGQVLITLELLRNVNVDDDWGAEIAFVPDINGNTITLCTYCRRFTVYCNHDNPCESCGEIECECGYCGGCGERDDYCVCDYCDKCFCKDWECVCDVCEDCGEKEGECVCE